MNRRTNYRRLALLPALVLCLAPPPLVRAAPTGDQTAPQLAFHVTIDPAFQKAPYSGRVYVILATDKQREPRQIINNWFSPPQIIARDVHNITPGVPIVLGDAFLTFPKKIKDLEPGEYRVQAVARRSLDYPVPGQGPGDLYSEAQTVTLSPGLDTPVELTLDRVVVPRPFRETDRVKLVEITSRSLSDFHGRPITIRAGVVLPAGFKEDGDNRYPMLYFIPGFGGSHRMARFIARSPMAGKLAGDVILVVPDPTCYRGHSVFADSENNGPWGFAFVHELIPEIERRFRGAGSGKHRYVTGVSSGGWSSLWLQINYPEAFNGCWAHVPDPVDFRDFQLANLYEPGANLFVDANGDRRPTARRGDQVTLWCDDFVHHEDILGPGGQIHSFEAVFSRRRHGRPELLFNRTTGAVNSDVARSWQRYDIRLILEKNWETLGPKLAGKLHVYAGRQDNFYLEGAVKRLKESLAKLGSDAEVKIIPDMAHGMYFQALKPMYETIHENFAAEHGEGEAPAEP